MAQIDKTKEDLIEEIKYLNRQVDKLEMSNSAIKEINAKLTAAESMHKVIFEEAAEGIVVLDAVTKKIYSFNSAMCQMFGYTREEFNGLKLEDLHPKDSLDYIRAEIEAKARREKALTRHVPCLAKDGRTFYVDVKGGGIILDGRVCELSFFTDVTESRRLEKDLQESLLFNKNIIGSVQEGFIVYDRDLRYRVWNVFMERISGKKASEVLGKHPLELFPFLKESGTMDSLEKALRGESPPAVEFFVELPDPNGSWCIDKNVPLKDGQGQVIGVIGTVYEITERKRIELDLQGKIEELGRLNKSLIESGCSITELKSEVNQLCKELGKPQKYDIA